MNERSSRARGATPRSTPTLLRARLVLIASTLVALNLIGLPLRPAEASPQPKERLAVLELKSYGALNHLELMNISDKLRAAAQEALGAGFMIMSREHISVLLEDPEIREACTSNCEIKVGRAIQAHYVMSGVVLSSGDELSATLKLHRVRDDMLIGIEEGTGYDRKSLEESLKVAAARLSLRVSSATGDGGQALVDRAQLRVEALPPLKELTVIKRFGIPAPILIQYDEALRIDEDEDEPIERKLEVWSRLSAYTKQEKLSAQARGRLAYWRSRYRRRFQCDQLWSDLSPIMSLSRAVSEAEKRKLAVDFLDECGRDPRENPHVKHPALREQIRREEREEREAREAEAEREREAREEKEREARERRREERREQRRREKEEEEAEERRLEREAKIEDQVEELSPLEVWIGLSHGVKAEGLSYHFRARLQLEAALKRAIFVDAYAAVVNTPTQLGEVFGSELGGALGYQWLNGSDWVPTASVGFTRSRGASFGVGELGVRYLYSPGWLSFALTAQYLKGFSLKRTQEELEREAQPEGPLDPVRQHIPRLDRLNGELRVMLWADTGLKGLLVGGLILYLISTMDM